MFVTEHSHSAFPIVPEFLMLRVACLLLCSAIHPEKKGINQYETSSRFEEHLPPLPKKNPPKGHNLKQTCENDKVSA